MGFGFKGNWFLKVEQINNIEDVTSTQDNIGFTPVRLDLRFEKQTYSVKAYRNDKVKNLLDDMFDLLIEEPINIDNTDIYKLKEDGTTSSYTFPVPSHTDKLGLYSDNSWAGDWKPTELLMEFNNDGTVKTTATMEAFDEEWVLISSDIITTGFEIHTNDKRKIIRDYREGNLG
ncbi:MAG: hypothetical protein U9Q38_02635 [Thermodesulfobacteriota bacterium]|nr:hypothetical protein [Thermodesulfobacteriota bacterium]